MIELGQHKIDYEKAELQSVMCLLCMLTSQGMKSLIVQAHGSLTRVPVDYIL